MNLKKIKKTLSVQRQARQANNAAEFDELVGLSLRYAQAGALQQSDVTRPDLLTRRIEELAAHWRPVARGNDLTLAREYMATAPEPTITHYSTTRERMLHSDLCNQQQFCQQLEDAYRQMAAQARLTAGLATPD